MAKNAKSKQKKLAKQKKKRLARKKSLSMAKVPRSLKASLYTQYPFYECLVPDGLFVEGLSNIIVARKIPQNNIAVSTFVVDVHCLGIKDAMFNVLSQSQYEHELKAGIIQAHYGQTFAEVEPACARKIIVGAVNYAKELGFAAHKDYHKAKGIFGNVDSQACTTDYEYGRDGKPFYFQGPHETALKAQKIVATLEEKCGEGNYDILLSY